MSREKDFQAINESIKQLLLAEYPTSRIKVNAQNKLIMIDGQMYRFSITTNLDYRKINLKKIQMKSKKGKLRSKNSKRILTKIAMMATVAGIGAAVHLTSSSNERVTVSQVTTEYTSAVPEKQTIPYTIVIEQEKPKENNLEENTITLFKKIAFTDTLGYEKKQETIQEFGDFIEEYSKRYGLDFNLTVALLTQERATDINDPSYNNIGQITKAICGEKISAPVFEKNTLISYDKIYVLPGCYDNYPLKDLETMGNFPAFTKEEQQKIQQAIKLKKEGYEIYRLTDVKNEVSLNIKISCAYLSYLINKQQNLVKGLASYNMGYTRINEKVSEEEILRGQVTEADDPNYLNNIFRYLTKEELEKGFTIQYASGEVVHYQIEGMDYEKETEHSIRR